MSKLTNKVAVITGGNSGIGFATAKDFIANGAKVIITGRNKEAVDKAVTELGSHANGIISDTSDINQTKVLVEKVKEQFGKIDILFVNAGIAKFASVADSTEALLDETFNINFKGAYFTTQHFLPIIKDQGSIIFTSSIATHVGMVNSSIYSASKGALHAFSKVLSGELASRGIRVNTVSPGPIETPIYEKLGYSPETVEEMGHGFAKKTLTGRFGRSEEVAKLVTFLASDDASFITGADYLVDGGVTVNPMDR